MSGFSWGFSYDIRGNLCGLTALDSVAAKHTHTLMQSHSHTKSNPVLNINAHLDFDLVYWSHLKYKMSSLLQILEKSCWENATPVMICGLLVIIWKQTYVALKRLSAWQWCHTFSFAFFEILLWHSLSFNMTDTFRLGREMLSTATVLKDDRCWTHTHAHNHLAVVRTIPEVTYFTVSASGQIKYDTVWLYVFQHK